MLCFSEENPDPDRDPDPCPDRESTPKRTLKHEPQHDLVPDPNPVAEQRIAAKSTARPAIHASANAQVHLQS